MNKTILRKDYITDTGLTIPNNSLYTTFNALELGKKYKYWYINLLTIVRNVVNGIEGRAKDIINKYYKKKYFYPIVKEISREIEQLNHLIGNDIKLIYYLPTYEKIYRKIDNVRTVNDFKGLRYYQIRYQYALATSTVTASGILVNKINTNIPILDKSIITTHYHVDLLNVKRSLDAIYLESFTGDVKRYTDFYTKYHKLGKKDMSVFPFIETLYWVLGDDNLIKPFPVKVREELYKLALKKRWNPSTSKSKVLYDIRYNFNELYKTIKDYPIIYG